MVKVATFTFLFLSLFICNSFAQSTESIHAKIDSLTEKSKIFCKSNFDSASFYANKAYELSDECAYPEGKINALSILADANLYLGSLDSSLILSNQVIENTANKENLEEYRFSAFYRICKIYHYKGEYSLALQVADKTIEDIDQDLGSKYFAMVYNLKGLIFKRTGKFEKAQEQFIEALAYVDDDMHYLRSIILTNLGIVNRNLEQYPQALDYYDRALISSEIIHDTLGVGLLYQNIAAVYSDLNENQKSLSYNLLAMDIIRRINYQSIEYATLLNNIGLNYEGLHQPDSSIQYLNQALTLSTDLEDTFGIADTKINLGRVYLKNNKPALARKNVQEGISIAKSIDADDLTIEACEVLIDCDLADHNFKSAFNTQKLLNALHDSVYNIEKVNAINELQEKYESEKKEQKIALLETENELKDSEVKQKLMQRNGLIGFATLIVLVTLIILYYFRKTRKAKNKIEILQREIHHRVKNNLAIIRRLADVTRQNLEDVSAQSAISDLISRIESMAQVHAQLYRKSDITEVNFKSYLNELALNIHASFSQDKMELLQDVEPSICVGFNKAVPLGLIINELLTNAFKYAKNDEGIKISLSAIIQADMLVIKVSDNGRGLPEGFDLQRVNSYGLKLVWGLVQQLNGSIQFYNEGGAVVVTEVSA